MRRPLPRELRRWMRGANVVALGLLLWAAATATWSPPPVGSALRLPPAREVPAVQVTRVPSLDEVLRWIHRFHPPSPSRGPAVESAAGEPVRPPLSAYVVSLLVGVDGADPRIVITCRDTSHAESYCLARGQRDRGAQLDSVRRTMESLEFDVSRGCESHTFVVPHRRERVAALDRIVGSSALEQASSQPAGRSVARGNRVSAAALHVKGVPFSRDGRVIGMRVTGVRPGSWARDLGLRAGDVIEAVNDASLAGASDVTAWQHSNLPPRRLVVLRAQQHKEVRLSLVAARSR